MDYGNASKAETGACFLGNASGCQTSVAAGLTAQLVAQMRYINLFLVIFIFFRSMGISFPNLDQSQAVCTGSCQPYLQGPAATALYAATRAAGGQNENDEIYSR